MKVLFLDINGVLNTYDRKNPLPSDKPIFKPELMARLKEITNKTDCAIVLTSKWREHWSKNTAECDEIGDLINSAFSEYGLVIFDKTPTLSTKEEEIEYWCRAREDVESFCVMQSDGRACKFYEGRLSYVRYYNGIDDSDLMTAVYHLNRTGKFALSVEDFKKSLRQKCSINQDGKRFTVTVEGFFGAGEEPLRLTFLQTGEKKIVRDNGSAISVLKKRAGESYNKEMAKRICSDTSFLGEQIISGFSDSLSFMRYLQALIFLSNADLYNNRVTRYFYDCSPYYNVEENPPLVELNEDEIKTLLSLQLSVAEFQGNYNIGARSGFYINSDTSFSHGIEPLPNGDFKIFDNRCYQRYGGNILENFFYNREYDEIGNYTEFFKPFLARFNGELNGRELSVTANNDYSMAQALMDFFNIAVIFSALDFIIELP